MSSFILLFARKRWGGGAAVLHELLVVVGGRGKRVGHTAEVLYTGSGGVDGN